MSEADLISSTGGPQPQVPVEIVPVPSPADSYVPDPAEEPDDRWLKTQDGELVYTDPPEGGGTGDGTVTSVNGVEPDGGGNVTLDADDVGASPSGHGHPHDHDGDYATAAQGATADTAVQPADLASALADLVDTAPTTLDTLGEIAEALGNDPNLATTLTALIGTKTDDTTVNAHLVDAIAAHAASAISVDASGFNGVLSTGDDTVQKVAQKLDDLAVSASGVTLTGTGAPSGGSDGDMYLQMLPATERVCALYGPKAGGVWPTTPVGVFRQPPSGMDPAAGLATAGIGFTLPLGVSVIYRNGATVPSQWGVNDNVTIGSSSLKRGASAAHGEAGQALFTASFDPPPIAVAAISAEVGALPSADRMGVGLVNKALGSGLYGGCDASGRLIIRSLTGATNLAQSSTGVVVATDMISFVLNGGVVTVDCISSANVVKATLKAKWSPTSMDTFFGTDASAYFDSTTDNTGRLQTFLAVT